MSKPSSGHFKRTGGSQAKQHRPFTNGGTYGSIKSNLDLREHPTKYKQLSSKKLKLLREKEANRTLTKAEYKHKEWQRRLTARRDKGIKSLAEALKKNTSLTKLHLELNDISFYESAISLDDALKVNTTLTSLYFY